MSNAFGVIFKHYQMAQVVQSVPHTNGCSFTVQDFETFDPECMKKEGVSHDGKKGWTYFYPTKDAHQAEFLSRVLQMVQKYQLFHWVQNTCDNVVKCHCVRDIPEYHINMLNHLSFINSLDPHPVNYTSNRNFPVKVYELDTKRKNLKPCFFVREYKIHNDMGPLYIYVMLTRTHEQVVFYNFDVRIIGSDEPLSEYISRIPIYDAQQVYQQECDKCTIAKQKYINANQEYINQICQLISSEEFRKGLQTYTKWAGCDKYENPEKCHAYNPKAGMCMGNCMWKNTIRHDGIRAYKLFSEAFGKNIGRLVLNGEFTRDKWYLMPDFSDRTFVDAYNAFCRNNGLEYYRVSHIFYSDFNMNVKKGLLYLNKYINRVETWGENPDSKIVPYSHDGQTFYIPADKMESERVGGITVRTMKRGIEPQK